VTSSTRDFHVDETLFHRAVGEVVDTHHPFRRSRMKCNRSFFRFFDSLDSPQKKIGKNSRPPKIPV
jgi:hypothetical protein